MNLLYRGHQRLTIRGCLSLLSWGPTFSIANSNSTQKVVIRGTNRSGAKKSLHSFGEMKVKQGPSVRSMSQSECFELISHVLILSSCMAILVRSFLQQVEVMLHSRVDIISYAASQAHSATSYMHRRTYQREPHSLSEKQSCRRSSRSLASCAGLRSATDRSLDMD